MIRIDMSIFVFPMSIFKSYVTGLGLASRYFRSCDGKMKAGTLFWPGAFSRQPADRSSFLSAQPIFIIQANGYYPSYYGFGDASIWLSIGP